MCTPDRDIVRAKGMTQVAKEAGVTRAQLELIEAGMDEYKDVYAFLAK